MKLLFATFVALVAGSGVTTTAQAHFVPHKKHMTVKQKVKYFQRSIAHEQTQVEWFTRARVNLRHSVRSLANSRSYTRWVNDGLKFHKQALRWHKSLLRRYRQKLAARARRFHPTVTGLPPHYREWLCIHGYEGAWNANTGNGYFGGLQMDISFQASYGGGLLHSKGTADKWTPLEQMWAAERAYASGRGFYPWPNTARYCGLL